MRKLGNIVRIQYLRCRFSESSLYMRSRQFWIAVEDISNFKLGKSVFIPRRPLSAFLDQGDVRSIILSWKRWNSWLEPFSLGYTMKVGVDQFLPSVHDPIRLGPTQLVRIRVGSAPRPRKIKYHCTALYFTMKNNLRSHHNHALVPLWCYLLMAQLISIKELKLNTYPRSLWPCLPKRSNL